MSDGSAAHTDPVAAARLRWQQARAAHGDHNPATWDALLDFAAARQSVGDSMAAVADATEALQLRREHLGLEHPDTLIVAGVVANWRYHLGDRSAVADLQELLPVMTRVLGAEHDSTLWVRHLLAVEGDATDSPSQRMTRWVELAGATNRTWGIRNQLTLASLYGAARARHDLGDPYGASYDAWVVVTLSTRALGARHVDTLSAELARLLWKAETPQFDVARQLADVDKLIPVLEDVFGHDHPTTLTARYSRAAWTPIKSHDEVDRISEWEVLLPDLLRVRGSDDVLTVAAQQAATAARVEWEENLRETRTVAHDLYTDMEAEDLGLDPADFDTTTVRKIADDADDQRTDAEELMADVLAGKRGLADAVRSHGNDSEQALQWRYWLAWRLLCAQVFEAANTRSRTLVADATRVLGETHPLTVASQELSALTAAQTWSTGLPYWEPDFE